MDDHELKSNWFKVAMRRKTTIWLAFTGLVLSLALLVLSYQLRPGYFGYMMTGTRAGFWFDWDHGGLFFVCSGPTEWRYMIEQNMDPPGSGLSYHFIRYRPPRPLYWFEFSSRYDYQRTAVIGIPLWIPTLLCAVLLCVTFTRRKPWAAPAEQTATS